MYFPPDISRSPILESCGPAAAVVDYLKAVRSLIDHAGKTATGEVLAKAGDHA
jgi:hypothetical protein